MFFGAFLKLREWLATILVKEANVKLTLEFDFADDLAKFNAAAFKQFSVNDWPLIDGLVSGKTITVLGIRFSTKLTERCPCCNKVR